MKRKSDERNFERFINYCVYISAVSDGDYLGELPIQLEELRVELGKQFDGLEEFSIQLEQQPIESVFQRWGLR